jgi:hypothetical protein
MTEMTTPTNEEGYTAPILDKSLNKNKESVKWEQINSYDRAADRYSAMQLQLQRLEFSIREVKESQSKMLWKLIAVIAATSFICGYLGIHNWLGIVI